MRSFPSSSGILNGSDWMELYREISSSRGRSPPLLIPRFIEMNVSTVGLSWNDNKQTLEQLEYGSTSPHENGKPYEWTDLDTGVMKTGVEHDDGEREDVARVRVGEDVRVVLAVPLSEALHHPVDLLRLAREPERPQELAEGLATTKQRLLAQSCNVIAHLGSKPTYLVDSR